MKRGFALVVFLAFFIQLLFAISLSSAVTNVWNCTGTSIRTFDNVTCWSAGALPVAGDDVVINGTSVAPMNITNNTLPQNLNSFTVTTGYTGTIHFSPLFANGSWGSYGAVGTQHWNVTNNIVINNGTLEVYGDYVGNASNTVGYNLTQYGEGQTWRSLSGNITVGSRAVINGIGRGFPQQEGPGFLSESGAYGGGGYNSASRVYGNASSPVYLGSGGGQGSGGGAIKLESQNSLIVDGALNFSGQMTVNYRASGGAIWLHAQNITGNGYLQAGTAIAGGGINRGAGGGGRIALTSSGTIDFSGTINVSGGIETTGGTTPNTNHGNGGTIYINATDYVSLSGNIASHGANTGSINVTSNILNISGTLNSSRYNISSGSVGNLSNVTFRYTSCSSTFLGNFGDFIDYNTYCPPTLTIFSPQNTTYQTSPLSVNFTASGGQGGTNSTWFFNGTANVTYSSLTQVALSNGNYTFIFYANDSIGNTSTTYIAFNMNTSIQPVVNLISPANNSLNTTSSSINFFYNVTDADQLANCSLIINGQMNKTVSSPSVSVSNNITSIIGRGYHNWSIQCYSLSGIEGNSENRTLNVSFSCFNRIIDGDETAIDSGGSCEWPAPANYKSGISLFFNGTPGIDYAEEYFYHDRILDDHKIIYLKNQTFMWLETNEFNTMSTDTGVNIPIGIYGEDNVSNTGDEGVIKYKIDRDLQLRYHWAQSYGGNLTFPNYTAPFSFQNLTYYIHNVSDNVSVVGTTGSNIENITDRSNYYHRGINDSFGDEWHVIAVAHDDTWRGLTSTSRERSSSDAKEFLFVINPKTPGLFFDNLTSSGQFYTTPAKTYFVPVIRNQTTYLTDNVKIKMVDIMTNSSVFYTIDDGPILEWNSSLNSSVFTNGTHTLKYWYNASWNKTRTIVKNPSNPSTDETSAEGISHGYLLWKNEEERTRLRNDILNASTTLGASYDFWRDDTVNDADSYRTGYRVRVATSNSMLNAFVANMEGISNATAHAVAAKKALLDNAFVLDRVGQENSCSGVPMPSRETCFHGYYAVDLTYSLAGAYDLLISAGYTSTNYSGGITPIEDYRIRDLLASEVYTLQLVYLMKTGDSSSAVDYTPQTGMWDNARHVGAVMVGLTIPEYNTNYYGTSGFDGTVASYNWTPYRDYPESWKDVYYTYTNISNNTHVEKLNPFPNRAIMFHPFDGGLVTNQTETVNRTLTNGTIITELPAGSWFDRIGYFGHALMGEELQIFANLMKKRFDREYIYLEMSFNNSNNRNVYGKKLSSAGDEDPRRTEQIHLVNEYFPNLAEGAYDYLLTTEDNISGNFYPDFPISWIFYNENWRNNLRVLGNASTLNATGFTNVTSVTIDNSTDLLRYFSGNKTIHIKHANFTSLEFTNDFNLRKLNLSAITLVNGTLNDRNYLFVNGLNATGTETLRLPVRNGDTSVCVLNSNVPNASYLISNCEALSCPGTLGNISCTTSDGHFVVANLSSSGIAEMDTSSDSTSPTVTLLAPINGTNTSVATTSFNATMTDNVNLSNATLYVWNSTGIVNQTTYVRIGTSNFTNTTFSFPRNGSYIWNYFVVDNSSNSAWATANFTINYTVTSPDTTNPEVTIISPTATTYTSDALTVNVMTNEVAICSYTLSEGTTNYSLTANSSNTGFTALTSALSNAAYTLRAYCNDSSNNFNSTEIVNFTVSVSSSTGSSGSSGGGGGGGASSTTTSANNTASNNVSNVVSSNNELGENEQNNNEEIEEVPEFAGEENTFGEIFSKIQPFVNNLRATASNYLIWAVVAIAALVLVVTLIMHKHIGIRHQIGKVAKKVRKSRKQKRKRRK